MGFVTTFIIKPCKAPLKQPPKGSFLMDRDGRIMSSTLPGTFPVEHLRAIGDHLLAVFHAAKEAQMVLTDIIVQYAEMKIQAQQSRRGAIVFVMPSAPPAEPVFEPITEPLVPQAA